MLTVARCIAAVSLGVVLSGCQHEDKASAHAAGAAASATPAPAKVPPAWSAEQWLGRWTGPEGTSLTLSKSDTGYQLTIQSLDGPNTHAGRATADRIEFERNGKTESIRATSGQETGMKWLADKTDCLTIQPGEGFCRD
ncbi:MAG: hypothetical protein Q7J29_00400 [Stagnimonas sp.]|nr:hypothetical protein [Stagnimonas sp.]